MLPQSGDAATAWRPALIAQSTGLYFATVSIHPGSSAGCMNALERNTSGSWRKLTAPIRLSSLRATDDVVERIVEETGGFRADYTVDATDNVGVMRQAVEAARMAWGLCTVAGVAGKGETLDIVPRFLITGRRVAGSSFGGVKGREGVPELVRRWMDGEIDVDPFISHRISLDEVNRAFELMEAQDGIRSVIEFDR